MGLPLLREDALAAGDDGYVIRLCLPWIRSLPLASVVDLTVSLDDALIDDAEVMLGDRRVPARGLTGEDGWWFVQDRLAIRLPSGGIPDAGVRRVAASFRLAVPYLQAGPDGPLTLPFHAERDLAPAAPASAPTVARDVA
jgi:hypothetical protein